MAHESIPEGDTLKQWEMPEFPVYNRGRLWYIIAGALAAALIIWAVLTTNFLFAIIVLIFAVILALSGLREPDMVEVRITETGVRIDEHFYAYRDITRFHIVYQPPTVKCLYLSTNGNLRPRICIHLDDQNPLEVRNLLRAHVKEDSEETDEPLIEFLGRILKI